MTTRRPVTIDLARSEFGEVMKRDRFPWFVVVSAGFRLLGHCQIVASTVFCLFFSAGRHDSFQSNAMICTGLQTGFCGFLSVKR